MARKKKIKVNDMDSSSETEEQVGQEHTEEPSVEVVEGRSPRDADFSQLEDEPTEQASAAGGDSQAREFKEKYLRALADFENFKKRTLKERSDLLKYQGEKVFLDMLEVVDNIDLALQHAEAEPEKLREGVELIHKMFVSTLDKWGVRASSALGKPFDPNEHAAISQIPDGEAEPGTVINELKKAYFYKDKLLRPSEVVVSVAPPEGGE